MSNQELTEDALLIQQISARYEVNKEILARIKAADLFSPVTLSINSFLNVKPRNTGHGYYTNNFDPQNGVQLMKRNNDYPTDLLEDPINTSVVIHAVEDFFNDKLDYSVKRFSDLERLNTAMLPIAKKYKFFGPTPPAIAVLTKFKESYDNIHVALGRIEANCMQRNTRIKTIQEQAEKLNKQYVELVAGIQNLSSSLANNTF